MQILRMRMSGGARLRATCALVVIPPALAALGGCGGSDGSAAATPSAATTVQVANAATGCAALANTTIPASVIGLSSQGASITSAALQAADSTSGAPEYCKVLGAVLAANASDPPIKFQANLPTSWNTKALQFGGGGFNGSVVTGLGTVVNSPAGLKTPLASGYVTFGGDSGHTGVGFDGSFGLNAQALANYSGESVKRTHDVVAALVSSYYKTGIRRMYYAGGSKGGHEAQVAAQRYGSDYDGVIAYYPANQNQAMVLSWYRMWSSAYGTAGAALNPAKQALLKAKVLEACDAQDGLADGIVGNTESCRASFAVNNLRCTGGADTGDGCLSDAQINVLLTAATPLAFAFPLANGVTSMGPYPVFQGGDVGGTLFDPAGTNGTATSYYGFDDPVIRFFIQQSAASTSAAFDYRAWQPRVQQISNLYDSTDPNLDTFQKKGGKMLLIQGTTDMLVTPSTTTAYYNQVGARYGDTLKSFLRYYVQPGFGHGGGSYAMTWDSLSALDDWVENNQAPLNPQSIDAATATKGRTRPICEYPQFPRYKGSGDVNSAASFACSAS